MSNPLRRQIKQLAPRRAKKWVWDLRDRIGGPPIDDAVLRDYRFVADADAKPRINLVIPNITAAEFFGGHTTGVEVFLALAAALNRAMPVDVRIIVSDATSDTDHAIVARIRERRFPEAPPIAFHNIRASDPSVAVRRNDIFTVFNWWTSLNTLPLIRQQCEHFAAPVPPLIYLIQEYEPHMLAFNSAQMLSRDGLDAPERLWGIVNSSNLARYLKRQGHDAERLFVFEPVINASLRVPRETVAGAVRKRRIFVYGRPNVPRNCFPALVRGLRLWASTFPAAQDWEVVSAGTAHKPILLHGDLQMTSLGKLPLDEYRQFLLESSVGVSLMASPHPSYPPLEMAHMGMHTVTNSYLDKDWTGYHALLTPIASIADQAIADAITAACLRHDAPRDVAPNTDYVREEAYPFIPELAASLAAEIAVRG
jgi:hypothetical protein